ncbi:MAG TPA: LptE family protein [Candidatus Binatia bacterium]
MKGKRLRHKDWRISLRLKKVKEKIQNRKSKIQNGVALGLLLLLPVGGCGYQFSGKGGGFPQDVRTVFIESFGNRTKEVGLDGEFIAALKSEFRQKGQLQIVDRVEEADAVLTGVVRQIDTRTVGINRFDEALQYEMLLTVDMSLRRRSPDELLWRTQGARFAEVYAGSRGAVVTTSSDFRSRSLNPGDVRQLTDIQLTETLKQQTRGRLIEAAAHDLHTRLLEMF